MNMTEYLTAEQDKWHRRYNDAEIEIDRLKRENESLKLAIHRLIMERDMAIRDIYGCEFCTNYNTDERGFCLNRTSYEKPCSKWIWRGVRR